MTFDDILKSSFLEKVTAISPLDAVIAMAVAFALGLFIFFVYKKTFSGVMYSQSFGISLIAMSLVTTLIIVAVTSNVILSLGMVGALSIVRFRTAIKEPLDIVYLFWSISAGIVVGAGLIPLAVFGSVVIGVVLVIFVNKKSRDNPYLLIVSCDSDAAENRISATLNGAVKKSAVKSKTVSAQGIELTIEVRLPEMSTAFVNTVAGLEGVQNAVLVSYNGDYLS